MKRPLRLALVCVAGLAFLEGAVRLRQWIRHGTSGSSVYALERDPATDLMIPAPGRRIGPIGVNSLGFRGPEVEAPKPPGTVRIAFLGGSTTFCAEVSADDRTWPALVTARLAAEAAPRPVDHVNAGAPGFSTKHSIVNLRRRVAALDPDVIVIYHATNDLNLDSMEAAEAEGVFSGDAERSSWLAERSVAWYLVEKNVRIRMRAQVEDAILRASASELSEAFAARLDVLLEEAKGVADVVALCTFQVRARRDQGEAERRGALRTSLYYMPYMDPEALLDGFEEYNRTLREAAARHGVLLVETDGALPGDREHFVDSVHLTDRGAEALAGRVADELLASERVRALLAIDGDGAAESPGPR